MSDNDTTEELSDELARKYDPDRLLKLVSKRAGKGELLDATLRAKYEQRFGVDLSHVRIYTGEFAEEFNRQRGAYAVTVGSTGMILMGGSPDKAMGSVAGQALLAHELTHVAQARRGLHNKDIGGMPFAQEHEAEAEAVEHSVAQSGGDPGAGGSSTQAAVDKGSADMAAKVDKAQMLEQVQRRVTELFADMARNQEARNGVARRA